MDPVCEIIEESGDLSDSAVLTLTLFGADAGALSDVAVPAPRNVVADTGDFSDAATGTPAAYLAEEADFSDAMVSTLNAVNVLEEQASFSDAVVGLVSETVADAADLSDSVAEGPIRATLADTADAGDAATPVVLVSETLAELADAGDHAIGVSAATVADTADATDAAYGVLASIETLADTADMTDEALPTVHASGILAETADLSEALFPIATVRIVVADEGFLDDLALAPGGTVAWTAPTDTFAMSRWAPPEYNSIACIGGKLYAASPGGLFLLEGDDDQGEQIDAEIRGGLTDFGDPALKRPSYYYLGYEADGKLAVAVGYTARGVEESAEYTFPARKAEDPVSNRTKLGRGIRSRYLRETIRNVNGADFVLHDRRMLLDSTSRRV